MENIHNRNMKYIIHKLYKKYDKTTENLAILFAYIQNA